MDAMDQRFGKGRALNKDLPWRRLAMMEHRGDPMTVSITPIFIDDRISQGIQAMGVKHQKHKSRIFMHGAT